MFGKKEHNVETKLKIIEPRFLSVIMDMTKKQPWSFKKRLAIKFSSIDLIREDADGKAIIVFSPSGQPKPLTVPITDSYDDVKHAVADDI